MPDNVTSNAPDLEQIVTRYQNLYATYTPSNIYWSNTDEAASPTPEQPSRPSVSQEAQDYEFQDGLPDDPRDRVDSDDYQEWERADMLRTQLIRAGKIQWCRRCEVHLQISKFTIIDDLFLCPGCEDLYNVCNICGQGSFPPRGMGYTPDDFECSTCVNTYVSSYNYTLPVRPRLTALDEAAPADGRLMFGVEFEFETRNKVKLAKVVDEYFPWAYVKHDGSLSHGIEIVTQPFTPNWMKENIDQFATLFDRADQCGAFSEITCGTHFHLSKTAFSSHHLYKFMKFIYENKNIMMRISGRQDSYQVERYASFNSETNKNLIRKAITRRNVVANEERGHDKYLAVNLRNPHTVEVRFFAGCTDFDTFMKYYQFLLGLYYFTKQASRLQTSWNPFRSWAYQNRKSYRYLNSLIESVG